MSALARPTTPPSPAVPVPWRIVPADTVKTGVLLVGTPATLAQLVSGLAALPDAPIPAGALVLGNSGQPFDLPGIPVLGTEQSGGLSDLPQLVVRLRLRLALVCLPASFPGRDRLLARISDAGLALREAPALGDLLQDDASAGSAADPGPAQSQRHRFAGAQPQIDLGGLIGRRPYEMDVEAVAKVITGKRVLITGAGGSIGSELAKVAAGLEPELLVLMERSENALFEIDRQIARHFPRVERRAVMHDVVDAEATMRACVRIRPHAVFHAAAHKHVPLMEDHPAHAVSNNVFGTKSIADASVEAGAERFVLISSDKAVNPTSVMGATKRLAEMYVRGVGDRGAAGSHSTRMSMVRFGNVLGSSASVLTIWAQQVAEGGPITITDPRMTRYFMTIPEAATLVVESTTLDPAVPATAAGAASAPPAPGVFVLDMGEAIRIVDLACRFARAHGLEPRLCFDDESAVGPAGDRRGTQGGTRSIDVVTTGIRPGEKLHEELAYAAEQLLPTPHPGIRAWGGPGFCEQSKGDLARMVADLHAARFSQDPAAVIRAIRAHVPEMRNGPHAGPDLGPNIGPAGSGHPNAG